MPPRPRPRPANRQASGPTQHAASSSKRQPTAKTDRDLELDKGDELFIRNRNRTAKDWQRLDRLAKEQASQSLEGDADEEELSDDDTSGSPRKRRRARQREGSELPEWTRQTDVALLAPDDDSDLEVLDVTSREMDDSPPDTNGTNKRPRSRSRSLTPPPGLSMQQIMNVRKVVSTTLQSSARADSPTNDFIDDSVDTIVLDEDLVSIVHQVRARVNGRGDLESGGGPEFVTIKVHWSRHSPSGGGRADVGTFEMKRHDTFHILFETVANTAGIPTKSLVLTHSGARVFASATPHSLKIWAEAQLDATDVTTFEHLREQRHETPFAGQSNSWSPPPGTAEDGESESDVQSVAEEDDDIFKLIVRSGVTKDVTLKVRPTTSCGAIVKAFLRRAGIADKYPEGKSSRRKSAVGGPRLMIDGDRMDPDTPISKADLEDGDQVEVTGL